MSETRVGLGTDIHRLAQGRKLIIGGVSIESEFGADGHSDADVLLHAITDALLGALALGDIGTHFPNSDPRWHGAESSVFVKHAVELLRESGFIAANIDCVIDLERPKLGPRVLEIRESIACMLGIAVDKISVKAKTGEGVDAVGRGEAVRAQAVVLIERIK